MYYDYLVHDVRVIAGEHAGRILTMYGRDNTTALLQYRGGETIELLRVPLEYLEGIEGTTRPRWTL